MRRALLVTLLVVIVAMALAAPAFAQHDAHCESGRAYGQHHAEMAQAGTLGGDHNPGMHHGYSHCLAE